MKNKLNAIFIEANRLVAGIEVPDETFVLCIAPEVLDSFISLHKVIPTKSEIEKKYGDYPVYWANNNKLAFECWIWNSARREWRHTGFSFDDDAFRRYPFYDGEEAIYLACDNTGSEGASKIVSCALSLSAIAKLVQCTLSKETFVMLTDSGLTYFEEFESFEYMFLNATGAGLITAPRQAKLFSRHAWI